MALGSEYRKVWAASAVSSLGDGVHLAALPLLAATLTREPLAVAGVALAGSLPWLVFGLAAGALVDRADRRLLMAQVDFARALVVGLLALAVLVDEASLPLLYTASFLLGTAETLFDSAAPAIVPALVEPARLDQANSRLFVANRVANEFAGPALGAPLFAIAAAGPFLLDAATFAVAATLLLAVRGIFRPDAGQWSKYSLLGDIREGLKWTSGHRAIRAIAASVAVLALVDAAWFSILVLYSLEILGLGTAAFGLLLVAGGAGSVVGGLATPCVAAWLGPGAGLTAALLLAAATQAVLGLISSVPVALVMLALSGAAFALWNVLALSAKQRLVPDRLLGRVTSAYRFLALGASAVGAGLGGVAAGVLGLRAPFLLGAPLLIGVAVLSLPALRSIPRQV
jgi:MFS family permease